MSNIYDEAFFAKIVNTYHIETSPLICRANQWTSFYMEGSSVIKELNGVVAVITSETSKCVNLRVKSKQCASCISRESRKN